MELSEIINNPRQSLDYMERLVNNGSPSGFTEINSTSRETTPFYTEGFYLYKVTGAPVVSYGDLPGELGAMDGLLVHPDWIPYIKSNTIVQDNSFYVSPTSSFRTVKVKDRDYYLKLSYPGIIGRLKRDLEEKHVLSVMQMSGILNALVNNKSMPDVFSYLPEVGGRVVALKNNGVTGLIVRSAKPLGKNVDKISYTIPAFSLFGKDRGSVGDIALLAQILTRKNHCNEYLLSQMIYPLIDIYFTCLLGEGISPEMHAQNVLFGFDFKWNVVAIILRDLESIDKDVTIRDKLGKTQFINDYKTIRESDYNYLIKHSFMFDHKLGEYLVEELVNCAAKIEQVNVANLRISIKSYVAQKYGRYIPLLFPNDGKWYKFDNVEINHDLPYRPYLALDNSIFR